ncbi:HTH-type transcriptional activator Btr [Rubripirellula tenax]|uniref:HTH-type transcriptional activator Btr n=1 Tax=Rubripirellula tenax TaxID=2528015 RepID=A0A5C6EE26_9BACT|nr:AraC family transcriptional regulator [Rubripirellula tenax]TWU46247.1 HTH-type transcriptional activator Btr [Rubripirellula tenax]
MSIEPAFISRQTVDARRFYLDLDPPLDAPLRVVCGGVERMREDYVVERSDFPYFGIELVTEGSGSLWLDDRHFSLGQGVTFAYGPGIPHRIENVSSPAMRKYYLDVVGTEAKQLLESAGLLSGRPVLIGRQIELTDLWDAIAGEAREHSAISVDVCQMLARILVLKIRQRRITDGKTMPAAYNTYETIRRYIENNYLSVSSIEEVSKGCDVSSIYVSRLFKRYSETGAYQFLLRLRMNHAAEMLIENRLKVQEVADVMGFSDAFQFSRAFKRVYGVAPSRLKKM